MNTSTVLTHLVIGNLSPYCTKKDVFRFLRKLDISETTPNLRIHQEYSKEKPTGLWYLQLPSDVASLITKHNQVPSIGGLPVTFSNVLNYAMLIN